MNISGRFFLFFFLCVFILTQSFAVHAASKKGKRPTLAESRSSVEINLDVLDRFGVPDPDKTNPRIAPSAGPLQEQLDYDPPPMFELVPKTRMDAEAQQQYQPPVVQQPPPQQAVRQQVDQKITDEPLTPMPQQAYEPQVYTPYEDSVIEQPVKTYEPAPLVKRVPQKRDVDYARRQEMRTTVISLPDAKKTEAVKKSAPPVKKAVAAKVVPVKAQPLDDELREDELAIHSAQDVYNALNDIKPDAGDSNVKMNGNHTSLDYQRGAIILEDGMKQAVLKNVVPKLKKGGRVEIQAHASTSADGPTSARRLSLARALEVRDFLVTNKISSKQIDIKPLGDQEAVKMAESGSDRVDIYIREASNH